MSRFLKFGDQMINPTHVISYGMYGSGSLLLAGGVEYKSYDLPESRDEEINADRRALLATGLFVEVGAEGEFVNRSAIVAYERRNPSSLRILLSNGKWYEIEGDDAELDEIFKEIVRDE